MRRPATLVSLLALCGAVRAQGVLDLLDGETLYDGGSLLTLGFEVERGDRLRRGERRIADPRAAQETASRATLAVQHGVRHDVQLGVALPFAWHERTGIGLDDHTGGLGDLDLLAKWRVWRRDAEGMALNAALLGALSLPTGDDDRTSLGQRLEPELQPGSGGIDPALGFAVTHEPARWRFNAAALYRWHTDSDRDGARLGDHSVVELAAGNRFWLEPYPGPFLRADLLVRHYWRDHSRQDGPLADSGGERATVGVNLAFRPRPSLDFQIGIELPFWQDVRGTDFGLDWTLDIAFGYRF
jgi:hypothetical protein